MAVNGRHWKVHSFCDAKCVQSTQQQTETGWGSISPLDCWRERSSDVKSGKMNKRSQSRSFLKISWCIRFWWYIQMAVKDKQKICVWNCGLCSAVTLSLHSAAMVWCACKRCSTVLCMCFSTGGSSLYNHIFFKNPRLSHALSFFLRLQVFYFCYNHSPQK